MNKLLIDLSKVGLCLFTTLSLTACSQPASEPNNNTETLSIDKSLRTTFKNNVITTPECTMEIKETKIVPPLQTSFMDFNELVVIYTLTNTGKENLDTGTLNWLWAVDVVQEYESTIEELDNGIYMLYLDENQVYRDNCNITLKPGGSMDLMATYEIKDMETPIQLIVHDSAGTKIGEKTFNLE